MFSRRHPFLFFILVFTAIVSSGVIVLSALFTVVSRDSHFIRGKKVGVVEVTGVIAESRRILENLKDFREDPSIQAIVIRINSPGGAVGPAQEIYREIRKTLPKKKTVASLSSMAASGGYYIAAAADEIFASRGTITGSIGVIMSYTNLQELFEKIGLSPVVIKSGEYKDLASPVKKMSEQEEQILQDFAEEIHQQFIRDVAAGRGLAIEKVEALSDGRIYTGEKAKSLGLIDSFGNLSDAVERAAELAGVKGKVVPVYPPEKDRFSLLEFLLGTSFQERIDMLLKREGLFGGYLYQPGE